MSSSLTINCKGCGEARKHAAKGLCMACYQYARRTGITPKARYIAPAKPCDNCRRVLPFRSKGLCRACYQWKLKHGTERPLGDIHPGATLLGPEFCLDCGGKMAGHRAFKRLGLLCHKGHGFCRACYRKRFNG